MSPINGAYQLNTKNPTIKNNKVNILPIPNKK
jgi:hypothetical protein